MVSLTEIEHPDRFESFCGELCSRLELGAPVHLAPGPDRGKDLLTRTPLRSGGERTYSIHIECKFSSRGRPLGVRDLLTHCGWAEARGVDVLLLMTNSRLTASAADWLDETESRRSFPVVVWDGEFLEDLVARLRSADDSSGSRLEERFEPLRITVRPDFVNREEELSRLCEFDSYRMAAITGPAGIGKTVLAQRVAHDSTAVGYQVVPVRLDGKGNDLKHISVPLARTLEALFDDGSLTRRLQVHLLEEVSDLILSIADRLSRFPLFLVVEDAHVLAPESRSAQLLEAIQSSIDSSRVLLTSRLEGLWRGCLVAPDLTVRLGGFEEADIRTLLSHRKVSCPDAVVTALAERYGGWPILVSLSCGELGTVSSTPKVAKALRQGDLQSASALAERLLASLSPAARRLFYLVVCLRGDLQPAELQMLGDLSRGDFRDAWIELGAKGLVTPTLAPLNCVHDLLKETLRPVLPEAARTDAKLADYFLQFDRDADRALAAVEHYLAAGDPTPAAHAVIGSQDVVLRAGRADRLLGLLAQLKPETVDELTYVDLAIVMARCFELKSRFAEGLDTLRTFIHADVTRKLPPLVLARARYWECRLLYFLGLYDEAERCSIEASEALRAIDPGHRNLAVGSLEAYILLQRARLCYISRDLESARALYRDALAIFEREEEPVGANTARHRLAMIEVLDGELETAFREFERVRAAARRSRDAKREAYALHRMGHIKRLERDWCEAKDLLLESLAIKGEIGHARGFVFTHLELAALALDQNDLPEAEEQIRSAQAYTARLEMPKEEANVYAAWARWSVSAGDLEKAAAFGREALSRLESLGLLTRAASLRTRLLAAGS